ncbi:hypothetical protein V1505DRAFT_396282 [Lipomyces doorenjongii]
MYDGRDEDEDEDEDKDEDADKDEQEHCANVISGKKLREAGNSTNAENSSRTKKSIVWQYFSKVEVKDRGVKGSNSTGQYRQHLKTHVIQNSTSSRQSIFDVGELFNRRPDTPPVLHTATSVTNSEHYASIKRQVVFSNAMIQRPSLKCTNQRRLIGRASLLTADEQPSLFHGSLQIVSSTTNPDRLYNDVECDSQQWQNDQDFEDDAQHNDDNADGQNFDEDDYEDVEDFADVAAGEEERSDVQSVFSGDDSSGDGELDIGTRT